MPLREPATIRGSRPLALYSSRPDPSRRNRAPTPERQRPDQVVERQAQAADRHRRSRRDVVERHVGGDVLLDVCAPRVPAGVTAEGNLLHGRLDRRVARGQHHLVDPQLPPAMVQLETQSAAVLPEPRRLGQDRPHVDARRSAGAEPLEHLAQVLPVHLAGRVLDRVDRRCRAGDAGRPRVEGEEVVVGQKAVRRLHGDLAGGGVHGQPRRLARAPHPPGPCSTGSMAQMTKPSPWARTSRRSRTESPLGPMPTMAMERPPAAAFESRITAVPYPSCGRIRLRIRVAYRVSPMAAARIGLRVWASGSRRSHP